LLPNGSFALLGANVNRVGAKLGRGVGAKEGAPVGANVGENVGDGVGSSVGGAVGTLVGVNVGAVGIVGSNVGALVGIKVGTDAMSASFVAVDVEGKQDKCEDWLLRERAARRQHDSCSHAATTPRRDILLPNGARIRKFI